MPIYKYTAINKSGAKITNDYSAKSQAEVMIMLKENEFYPIRVEEHIERKEIVLSDIFNKITIKDIAVFCRQFYTMLNAGVTITSALDILRQQTENKKFRKIISDICEDVQKGSAFSEALKKRKEIFPDLLINMVEAGEVSGNLDTIMDRMANHFEKEFKINNKIKSAMVYPIILSVVAIGVVVFLLTSVMPTFIGMFTSSGVPLPVPTRILLGISSALQNYWYIFFIGIISITLGINAYKKTDGGKLLISRFKLAIPVLKDSNKKIITSRFTRTLSTLLSSGVPLLEALDIVSKVVGNVVIEKDISVAKEEVRKGSTLAKPIRETGHFPPMVTSMIEIGEESGALDDILEKTANFYDEELETAIQRMTTLIEPIMIVLMAVIVGFIVISMALPMFDMVNTVQM